MRSNILYSSVSEAMLEPNIIQIQPNLYVLSFKIMKLLPAKFILQEQIKKGHIKSDFTIVDTSSGTFALGMGLICAELKLPFQIFSDPAMDEHLIARIEDLGGKVTICRNPEQEGAYQKLRLQALHQFLSENTLSFWLKQYDNLDNRRSYHSVGEKILSTFNRSITLVGTVGSGGSTCGITQSLRERYPETRLVGVDTFNSVLFGQTDGKRFIRGLGNSIMPKNLQHELFDEIHWVSANDAFQYTRKLFSETGLFAGPTTGAAYQVALHLAQREPKQTFLFISPDEGHRYINDVYSDRWLKSQAFYKPSTTPYPQKAESPQSADGPWAFFSWNRQAYEKINRFY